MTTIGVTGHRFLEDIECLTVSIDRAFEIIEDRFVPPYTLVSSLAEGADSIVAERALARWEKTRLIVSLPLDIDDYLEDFSTVSSKAGFLNLLQIAGEILPPPVVSTRQEAYSAAGDQVIERCDVLIALWDGKEAQGEGGTGEIVAAARERGLPLIWIQAGNRIPGTETPTTLGQSQGRISLENF